jgi:hypothetical protein
MVIDEANECAIEEMAGQNGGEQPGNQSRAPIERDGRQRPHRRDREDADHSGHHRRDTLDVID